MNAPQQQRIVITGFMGAGKTTVAAALARRTGCLMLDLDGFIAAREGRTPQQIIDEDGEPRFRDIEIHALRAALEAGVARGVVALGGGTWTIEQNRALIAEHDCLTVWLDAPFELCWQRIRGARGLRPLARDREKAQLLYDERRTIYELAALRVQVAEERGQEEVADEIASALLYRGWQM